MAAGAYGRARDAARQEPADRLREELSDVFDGLLDSVREWALAALSDKVSGLTERLTEYAETGGGPGLVAAITGARQLSGGKSPVSALLGGGVAGAREKAADLLGDLLGRGDGGGRQPKPASIVESIDVGAPVRVAYNQWTQLGDLPSFMEKAGTVDQESGGKPRWEAQACWSHRTWESTIIKQEPDEIIVWRSAGAKGYVDGAVTFHELAPKLTRILLVLEYHPKGIFERTGNIWRAQGRRVRLELKHFRCHVMTQTVLHPGEAEGWRGVIADSKVVKDHETALRQEQEARGGGRSPEEAEQDEAAWDEEEGPEFAEAAEEAAEAEPAAEEPEEQAGEPREAGYGYDEEEEERSTAAQEKRQQRPPPVVRRRSGAPLRSRR